VARASAIGGFIDMWDQCTHMFDLAGLAIAAAYAKRPHRCYEIMVTDRRPTPQPRRPHTGRCVAELRRDGGGILRWDIDEQDIVGRPELRSLLRGFRSWTETLPVAEAEACLVLRRCVGVAAGRAVNVDSVVFASEIGLPPVCHTYRPDQAAMGRRNVGNRRDFSAGTQNVLANLGGFGFEGNR
jgi:hypothetical protein